MEYLDDKELLEAEAMESVASKEKDPSEKPETQDQASQEKVAPTSEDVQEPPAISSGVSKVRKPLIYGLAGAAVMAMVAALWWSMWQDDLEKAKAQKKSETYQSQGAKDPEAIKGLPEGYGKGDEKDGGEGVQDTRSQKTASSESTDEANPFSKEALERRAAKEDAKRRRQGMQNEDDPWKKAAAQEQARAAKEFYASTRGEMVVARSVGRREASGTSGASSRGSDGVTAAHAMPGNPDSMMVASERERQREFYERDRRGEQTQSYEQLREPRSPYLLQAGDVIPLSLVTAINSDVPGPIQARVKSPVYDSVEGKYLLVPQGSKMLGEYSTTIRHGQERVQVMWKRLILPNGKSVQMNAPGVANSGAAGYSDTRDLHYEQIFAGAIASSLLSLGSRQAAGTVDQESVRPEQLAAAEVGANISDVGGRLVERELQIKPTLNIRRGFGVQAYVSRDIELEPYSGEQ
jgi:type IV secretion system protein VirB10